MTATGPMLPLTAMLLFVPCSAVLAQSDGAASDSGQRSQQRGQSTFVRMYPSAHLMERAGRIHCVYGTPFSEGEDSQDSADSFVATHAALFGVNAVDLVPGPLVSGGCDPCPAVYQPATGEWRFFVHNYRHEIAGVPVFRSVLKLLVRSEPGFPLVFASADLRPVGSFKPEPRLAAAGITAASAGSALLSASSLSAATEKPAIVSTRRVIWAGFGDIDSPPLLADESTVTVAGEPWLIVTEAANGAVLYREHLTCFVDIGGQVDAEFTPEPASEDCNSPSSEFGPLPYVLVTAGGNSAFSDESGAFTIPNPGSNPITVSASLNGQWFDIATAQGPAVMDSEEVMPPGPATLLLNEGDQDEFLRAQVNAYVYANRIRDFVVDINFAFPFTGFPNMNITVNWLEGLPGGIRCPANGAYHIPTASIHVCASGELLQNILACPGQDPIMPGPVPNSAFSSLIYHEYGHHLVQGSGSFQMQYGEGMGDVMSVVMLDAPEVFVGLNGNCMLTRNADNDCQYDPDGCAICADDATCNPVSCVSPHCCGQLLSGCVWSIRNELILTEPENYRSILSGAAINAMLLHSGFGIEPDIVVAYLEIDDDDLDITNGTPHFAEFTRGFAQHNMYTIGDLNVDGVVNSVDFLQLLSLWGSCPSPCPPFCHGDVNCSCTVDTADMLLLLQNWSPP